MHSETESSSPDSQPRGPSIPTPPPPWWWGGWKIAGVSVPWRDKGGGVFWDPRASGLEESRRHVGSEAARSPVETRHPCLALRGHVDFTFPHCGTGAIWEESR